ncbi:hypothetical protein ADUPG1_003901, partial [Aduncisulcus paluster]
SLLADLWSHALTPSSCPNTSHWRSLSSPGVPSLTYTHAPLVSHIPIHSHTLTYALGVTRPYTLTYTHIHSHAPWCHLTDSLGHFPFTSHIPLVFTHIPLVFTHIPLVFTHIPLVFTHIAVRDFTSVFLVIAKPHSFGSRPGV